MKKKNANEIIFILATAVCAIVTLYIFLFNKKEGE